MSTYNWQDPTLPEHIGRTWSFSRVLQPDRVSVFVPKRNKHEALHMLFPIGDWAQFTSGLQEFEAGRTVRYRGTNVRISFGFEKIPRRDYADVMHIRGVWDGQAVAVKIPIHHWIDIVECMELRPSLLGAERLDVLFDE